MLIEIKVKKPVKVPTSYDTSVGEVNCNVDDSDDDELYDDIMTNARFTQIFEESDTEFEGF